YRELIMQLVRRDLVSRYKRSFLGVAWTMLNPLGTMLILTLVFSHLFKSVSSYPVFILSGLIGWNFFSQATTAALSQNVWGGSLLHKVYMPRTVFTVSAIGTGVVNLLLSLVPLLIIMLFLGQPFHISILFLPVSILLLTIFTLGIGLLVSTLALYFPDVVDMYHIGLTAWMYLTPIIYPAEIIPEAYRRWILVFNPMYYLVEMIRQPIYDGHIPSVNMLTISIGVSFIALIIGWLVFNWKANEFTYRT
ncbi:MAG: ABC transporter permease, partial [Anaerolineaceae bacterium]|nr:ABC transporter permease [Anaerolineaceae bacterium]